MLQDLTSVAPALSGQAEPRAGHLFDRLVSFWARGVVWAVHSGGKGLKLHDTRAWVLEKLHAPGVVAVMLPNSNGCAPKSLDVQGHRRVRERAVADITFCGSPHRIWLLELQRDESSEQPEPEPEASQLHWLGILVEHATASARPRRGPWIWPLHNKDVSAAILAAHIAPLDTLPWWRQALWALRILAPPGVPETQRQLAAHYGAAVAYVFAWSNLYLRGLWGLMVYLLLTEALLGAAPGALESPWGGAWSVLQVGTLLWCIQLANAGRSLRRVLTAGGFEATAGELPARRGPWPRRRSAAPPGRSPGAAAAGHGPKERGNPGLVAAAAPATRLGALGARRAESPPAACGPRLEAGGGVASGPRREELGGVLRWSLCGGVLAAICRDPSRRYACEAHGDEEAGRSRPVPRMQLDGAAGATEDLRAKAAIRLQAAARGRICRAKLQHQARLAARVGEALGVLKKRNFEHWKPKSLYVKVFWHAWATLVAVVMITAFTALCVAVLLAFVQLNIYLIFIWGGCLREEVQRRAAQLDQDCHDPEFVRGMGGWLAEVGSDIALAILFDVLLGEASKVLARFLIRLRNYEWLHDQRYATLMLSLFIEALSKVGMFAILGFIFLPQWTSSHPNPAATVAQGCTGLPDYELCKAALGCNIDLDDGCCQGAMLCIARHIAFPQRQRIFEGAVKGPFCVAPFVRILVTVVIPWVAGLLEDFVIVDAREVVAKGAARRQHDSARWAVAWRLRELVSPLLRAVALIFHLDGDSVGGLGYVFRGWPFGRAEVEARGSLLPEEAADAMRTAVDQSTRKVFEPFEELIELKMNFLFLSFFAPIMPIGVVPTLVARLLEVRSETTKLFFVRRRCWPGEARLLHETQDAFAKAAAHAAVVWHVGLVVVAYNPHLAEWGAVKALAVWIVGALAMIGVLHGLIWLLPRRQGPLRSSHSGREGELEAT